MLFRSVDVLIDPRPWDRRHLRQIDGPGNAAHKSRALAMSATGSFRLMKHMSGIPVFRSMSVSRFRGGRKQPCPRSALACPHRPPSSSRSSRDQSASARQRPWRSGCPARICSSTTAISARQRRIHGASANLFDRTSSKEHPSASRIATLPVYSCQRRQITSEYFGSSSINRA